MKLGRRASGQERNEGEIQVRLGKKATLAYGVATAALLVPRYFPGTRNLFPEPWDLFDHSGNFLPGPASAAAGFLAARAANAVGMDSKLGLHLSAISVAWLAGAGLNAAAEDHQVTDVVFHQPPPVSSQTDFVYGTLWSALGGALLPAIGRAERR